MEVTPSQQPNAFGALLVPGIYRDIEVSDMYLVEDITARMLVPAEEVPAFQPTSANKKAFQVAYKGVSSSQGPIFKGERKSDFAAGSPSITTKKVRGTPKYQQAKERFKEMMGTAGDEDGHEHGETMYILRCLDTECSEASLYQALSYYSSDLINTILLDDFDYNDEQVHKNKANLLLVCEAVLNRFNIAV